MESLVFELDDVSEDDTVDVELALDRDCKSWYWEDMFPFLDGFESDARDNDNADWSKEDTSECVPESKYTSSCLQVPDRVLQSVPDSFSENAGDG